MSELVAYVKEHGDHIYIQSPVGVYQPEAAEIETFAFADELKLKAPNPHLMWLRGQYVEADNANQNGDQWRAGDLAIKVLTPMLMPITVMHDMRTAVGTIADTRLLTPDEHQVPRSRLETVLALWGHRFPEVAEEAKLNAQQGTLMQSMECVPLDTEILTRRGWRRYDELRDGDETVGYNPSTERSEWTPITATIRKRAEVFNFFTGRWRAVCTAGHGWMARHGARRGTRYVFEGAERVEARDLNHRHQLILTALADLDGDELPITPPEAAVIAWIAGDGSIRSHRGGKDFQATITQSKPDGVMALEMALADASIEYTVSERAPQKEGAIKQRYAVRRYYIPVARARDIWMRAELDHLSWGSFILRLSSECRAAFMEAIYQAEGNENHGSRCIAQMPGPLKDAIALGAYLEGYRPVSHEFGIGDSSQANSHVRLCRSEVNGAKLRMLSLGDAEVWCPTTALGSWTMRQGDQILLTGNCISPAYDCSVCGMVFQRLPHMAEKETWCAHLKGEDNTPDGQSASRILRNVVFTGTGLIFGTRGSRGAYPEAHLEMESEVLAELHRQAHSATASKRPRRKNHMELTDEKYQELVAAQSERDRLKAEKEAADKSSEERDRKLEEAETAKVKAEEELKSEKDKREAAEEKARVEELRKSRLGDLGSGFRAKLEKLEETKKRVEAQAGTFSDEEWTSRLTELEESLGVKRDDKADGTPSNGNGNGDDTALLFDRETVASSAVSSGDNGQPEVEQTETTRHAVIGGLLTRPTKTTTRSES